MRKLMTRFVALFRPPQRRREEALTPIQSRTLKRNLRELLLTKEALSDRNETAA